MNTNRRKQVNPVQLSSLIRWLLVAAFIGASGLFFVYIKNQQFALAEETRQVERRIANVRSQHETLLARVTELSSRRVLQQRPDGTRAVVSHFNKATKGRLVRHWLDNAVQADDAEDLADACASAGVIVELGPRPKAGAVRRLDVVVTDL